MSKWWTRLRRLAKLGVLLALAALMVHFVVMPWLARRAVQSALAGMGWRDVHLSVQRATLWSLHATDLRLGDGSRLRVQSLRASYSPGSLWRGRIDRVELVGARLEVRVQQGRADLGPLAARGGPLPSARPAGPGAAWPEVVLRQSEVVAAVEGWRFRVPVEARLAQPAPRELEVSLDAVVAALPLHLGGRLPLRPLAEFDWPVTLGGMALRLQGVCDTPADWLEVNLSPATGDGAREPPPAFRLTLTRHAGLTRLGARVEAPAGPLHAELGGIALRGMVRRAVAAVGVDQTGALRGVELDAALDQLSIGGATLGDVRLTASAAGWPPRGRARIEVASAHGSVAIESESPAGTQPAAQHSALFRLDARWDGPVPRTLADLLRGQGLGVDGPAHAAASGVLRLAWRGAGDEPNRPAWEIQAPQLGLQVRELDAAWLPLEVKAQRLSLDLTARLDADPGGVRLEFTQPGRLAWTGLRVGGAEPRAWCGAAAWDVRTPGDVPWLTLGWRDGPAGELACGLACGAPLRAGAGPVDVSAQPPRIELRGRWAAGTRPSASGTIIVPDAEVVSRTPAVTVSGVSLRLPLRWNSPAGAPNDAGTWQMGAVRAAERTLPALAGRCGFVDGVLTFEGASAAQGDPTALTTRGELRLEAEGVRGEVRGSLSRLKLDDAQWLGRVFPQAGGIALTGQFGCDAVLTLDRGRVLPWLTVVAHDAALSSRRWGVSAEGIESTVHFDRLAPLHTPPSQWLTARSLRYGKLELRDGLVQFTMQQPRSILVERTEWTLGDEGRFRVHAFWMDPAARDIRLEVFLENVNTRDLLALVAPDKVRGEGLIQGRIPVVLHPQDRKLITLGRGTLYGTPGQTGWWEVQDRKTVNDLVQQALGGQELPQEVQERMAEALADLEYVWVRVSLVPEAEGVLARVEVSGKGRKGAQPQEFKRLTINVRGLDDLLDLYLRSQGGGK